MSYEPINVQVSVPGMTMDTIIGDAYNGEPLTLLDCVVKETARILLGDTDHTTRSEIVKRVRDIRVEEIREQVRPLIAEALAGELQRTNSFGEPTGQATTLREMVVAEAKRVLGSPTDRYSSNGQTFVQKLVAEEVGRVFEADLRDAMAAEKAKAVAAVRAKAADLLAEVLSDGLKR